MLVLKFGGTSVGKPERMHSVAQLISSKEQKIVVLSAVSGTTNSLVEIAAYLSKRDNKSASAAIDKLNASYLEFIPNLYKSAEGLEKGNEIIEEHFTFLRSKRDVVYSPVQEKEILAEGELISTALFQAYLEEIGFNSILIPALDFMKIDENSEPDLKYIEKELTKILEKSPNFDLYITQGYICRNHLGEVDNLKRGGSDYTASLVGAAIYSSEIQIWTDIDGMHNNDPRIVKKTFPISELSFDEAAELAYFGAKILHPTCINPARDRNIPVRLLNTMQPEAAGTLISSSTIQREIKAVAAKDNITAVYINSSRMLLAYGFLSKVFNVFEKYKTPVDMITTSEVAVSLTIDDTTNLDEIVKELSVFANVEAVEKDQTIVCVVGNFVADKSGVAVKVFDALRNVPIQMISYGGSEHNISILIPSKFKNDALNALNEGLFVFEDQLV